MAVSRGKKKTSGIMVLPILVQGDILTGILISSDRCSFTVYPKVYEDSDWDSAMEYAAKHAIGRRLPTVEEAEMITKHYDEMIQILSSYIGKRSSNTFRGVFWTCEEDVNHKFAAKYFNIENGSIESATKRKNLGWFLVGR